MKKSEIVEGCCYTIDPTIEGLDFIEEEVNQGHLLKNKGRPYMVVFCNRKDSLVWVAPLSSRYQKYQKFCEQEKLKYGSPKSYLIVRNWRDKNAILLSNAFPVLPKYIQSPYVNTGRNIPIHSSIVRKTQAMLSKKIFLLQQNNNKVFWGDVNNIRKGFEKLDFRHFNELSVKEQKKVVYHNYMEYLDDCKTEKEYKAALRRIYTSLYSRTDISFNPNTLEKRVYNSVKFGLPLEEIKKNNPFYKHLSSREVYVISKELEKRKVQYSAVIKQDGEGQITVQRKDGNTLTRLINTNRNNISNINRKLELDSAHPEKYLQIACKMEDALMICSRFDGYDVPYSCSFYDGKTARLTVRKENSIDLQHAMKKFDVFAKIQPMQQMASQNMQSLTL